MHDSLSAILLLTINLGLIWLFMAAPIGRRTIRISKVLPGSAETVWHSVHPSSSPAWNPALVACRPDGDEGNRLELTYRHPDRRGQPITRTFEYASGPIEAGGGYRYAAQIVADSALDVSFWRNYSESRTVVPSADGARVTVEQSDHYRGIAFLLYRYVTLKREVNALEDYVIGRTPVNRRRFEHPLVQVLLAVLSTLILWPFFGLTQHGLLLSSVLTMVIVLHELGHMAAYRAFGHNSVRLIFIPLLGGIAIGGRPYNSRFEVATCALMGAGMSGFLVPAIIAAEQSAERGLWAAASGPLLVLLLILGGFNLLNLLPMSRFDGGQVLRQIFRTRSTQMLASFGITGAILWTGWRVGMPSNALLAGLAVFTLMSLFGAGGVKPKDELDEMTAPERLLTGFGLYAAVSIHAYAVIMACDRLFG